MDLWITVLEENTEKKTKDKKELIKMIHEALEKGELITDPKDKRKYKGKKSYSINKDKPIIVIKEDKKSS